ncbi:alpha/beta fold hydrolase [Mycobacteroides abscessus]
MTQRSMPVLDGVEHQYVQAGDVKIHVAVAGPQDGRAVVLLHGWPENWWMWHKVIPALAAAGYRVHAMDLRGAGWSEVAPAGYEKEQFASDVLAAADALGLESFDLVGHDWGGWTAQLVALKAQSRIRRLVVLNIPPVWQQPGRVARYAHKLAYQLVVGIRWSGLFHICRRRCGGSFAAAACPRSRWTSSVAVSGIVTVGWRGPRSIGPWSARSSPTSRGAPMTTRS